MGLGAGGGCARRSTPTNAPTDYDQSGALRVFVQRARPLSGPPSMGNYCPTPVDREAYVSAGLPPWFDYYDADAGRPGASGILTEVATVGDALPVTGRSCPCRSTRRR